MDDWTWFIEAIGVAGFLMAIQPFTQAIWGRPKLVVNFGGEGDSVKCVIQNIPVSNKFLRKICVSRMPVNDLSVMYWITKVNSKDTSNMMAAILNYGNNISEHISLPSTIFNGATFTIEPKVGESFFSPEKTKLIESGTYTLHINVIYDTNNLYLTKNIIVRTAGKPTYIGWEIPQNEM